MDSIYFMRALCERAEGKAGEPLTFIASTPGIKRDGLNLDMADWTLENYRRNPVFLWVHSYNQPPIGRAEVTLEGDQLKATVTFDQEDEFARLVESKYRRAFLNAVSVGWNSTMTCPNCDQTFPAPWWRSLHEKCPACGVELPSNIRVLNDLLDVSAVPVPGDPDALMERQRRALAELRRNLQELDGDDGEALWADTAAAMVGLFMPGADDTDEGRRKRYQALLPRYRRLGKTPLEFLEAEELAGLGPDELRGLFLEGEPELVGAWQDGTRAGAVLSQRNRDALQQAMGLIQGVLDSAKKESDGDGSGDEPERDVPDIEAAALEDVALRALKLTMEMI